MIILLYFIDTALQFWVSFQPISGKSDLNERWYLFRLWLSIVKVYHLQKDSKELSVLAISGEIVLMYLIFLLGYYLKIYAWIYTTIDIFWYSMWNDHFYWIWPKISPAFYLSRRQNLKIQSLSITVICLPCCILQGNFSVWPRCCQKQAWLPIT